MGNLILLRHAKSDWTSGAPTDFERPLNKRGRRNATRMAQWIAAELPKPERILCSPSERTRQTVLPVCEFIGYSPEEIHWKNAIYEATLSDLLSVLRAQPDDLGTLMLVGHSPGMETLTMHLIGAEIPCPGGAKPFPTAAVAHLQVDAPWSALTNGCAKLATLVRPKDLDES
jgi:phosphohistidine phosphatase